MKVVIGSDHAGFELKMVVREYLRGLGFDVLDVGTDSTAPVDYPDFASARGESSARWRCRTRRSDLR